MRAALAVLALVGLAAGCADGATPDGGGPGSGAVERRTRAPAVGLPAPDLQALRAAVLDESRPDEERAEAYEALVRGAPREELPGLRKLAAGLGERARIAHARARIAANDGRGFGDLLSMTLSGYSPRLKAAVEKEFGGPPPPCMNWWVFWEFARADTAHLARKKLAAIRWFHTGPVDVPSGKINAGGLCERLAKTTGLDWICLEESRDVEIRVQAYPSPMELMEESLLPAGLSLRMDEGVLVVASAERVEEMDTDVFPRATKWPAELRTRLEQPLALDLRRIALAEALAMVGREAGLEVRLHEGVKRAATRVTARVADIQAADALELLIRIGGARGEFRSGGIFVSPRDR